MATNFPTSLDSFSALVDNTDGVVAAHPNNRGDGLEAAQAKIGVDSSAVATSHDYLLTHLPAQVQNWDAGAYEVRAQTFESDIATGTAPLVIASTTVVTNLNADLLDGNHAAGFVLANGTVPLTANWDVGAYTITGTQFISDIAIGTAPLVVTSTTVVTNLNADTLDGAHKPTGDIVGTTDSQTLTTKTLTAPDINGGTVDAITSLTVANSVDIGAFELRAATFESDIGTGTAPLTIASTTLVNNLNADLLDGQEGSYYRSASNLNAGTLPAARLSTYDSGWFAVTEGTAYSKTHSLGTTKVAYWLYFSTSADGTDATGVQFYQVGGSDYGTTIKGLTTTTIVVQTADALDDSVGWTITDAGVATRVTSGYIRLIMMALA